MIYYHCVTFIFSGVASLLSFRLFLLNVADTIPRTSDHVPLLGVYIVWTQCTCSFGIPQQKQWFTINSYIELRLFSDL